MLSEGLLPTSSVTVSVFYKPTHMRKSEFYYLRFCSHDVTEVGRTTFWFVRDLCWLLIANGILLHGGLGRGNGVNTLVFPAFVKLDNSVWSVEFIIVVVVVVSAGAGAAVAVSVAVVTVVVSTVAVAVVTVVSTVAARLNLCILVGSLWYLLGDHLSDGHGNCLYVMAALFALNWSLDVGDRHLGLLFLLDGGGNFDDLLLLFGCTWDLIGHVKNKVGLG